MNVVCEYDDKYQLISASLCNYINILYPHTDNTGLVCTTQSVTDLFICIFIEGTVQYDVVCVTLHDILRNSHY